MLTRNQLTFRDAFGIRGILIREIVFIACPSLLLFGIFYWFLHAPVSEIAIYGAYLLLFLGILTFLTMTLRFDNAVSVQYFSLPVPVQEVNEAIPKALASNHWRLVESCKGQGSFKARIGMTRKTWGQLVQIDVNKADGASNIKISCESIAQQFDLGANDMAIYKFQQELERITRAT